MNISYSDVYHYKLKESFQARIILPKVHIASSSKKAWTLSNVFTVCVFVHFPQNSHSPIFTIQRKAWVIRVPNVFSTFHCPILLLESKFEVLYIISFRQQWCSNCPSKSISHTMHCMVNIVFGDRFQKSVIKVWWNVLLCYSYIAFINLKTVCFTQDSTY